jgi:hypothetical protein
MTERLGPPDTGSFPSLEPSHVWRLPVGTWVGRIYAAGGKHPGNWRAFRAYGPSTARFDHQPPPPREHPKRRITYLAAAVPDRHGVPLRICLAEVFRDRGVVELRRDDPYFTLFNPIRELRLLDLSDSDWVSLAGGNGAITSGARYQSRSWARAIYRCYKDVLDGVIYSPSNLAPARPVALWERAEDALPERPAFNEPLTHVGLRARIETYAAGLGLPVIV